MPDTAEVLTILLVDDDADLRLAIRTALEDEMPYAVVEESDGLLAWDYVRTFDVPLIIVCDHQMPYLDGPGLLSFIHEHPGIAQRVAPIYLTAGSRVITPALQQLLDELHVPVMRKPFDVEALLAAIAAAARRVQGQAPPASAASAASAASVTQETPGEAEPRRDAEEARVESDRGTDAGAETQASSERSVAHEEAGSSTPGCGQ